MDFRAGFRSPPCAEDRQGCRREVLDVIHRFQARLTAVASALLVAITAAWPGVALGADAGSAPESLPQGWTADRVTPVGYLRVGGARTFKLGLREAGGRWYLFVAEGLAGRENGTFAVVDVTDPGNMRVIKRVDVPYASGQLTLHGDLLIVGRQPTPWAPPETGGSMEYPFRGSPVEERPLASLFDLSDPGQPEQLSEWIAPGFATHRNGYPGGPYAFMSAWVPGYRGQSVLVILDVSDPKEPREAGRWWLPGQAENEEESLPPPGFHGPAYLHPDGRSLTLGYTPALVNLDISDPASPKLIGRLDFSPLAPVGTQAIHTAAPIGNGHFLVSTEPSAPGCDNESLSFAAIVDNRDLAQPRLVSYLPRPVPDKASGLASFCGKEGRFGPHNTNTETHQEAAQDPDGLVYLTYFNAGLRIFDVSDPRQPHEVGWFLPAIGPWSEHFRGPEDVIVDTRGNVFVSDGRAAGIWALRMQEGAPE